MKRTAAACVVGVAILTLLTATVRSASAFDLTGRWTVKRNQTKCRGLSSTTAAPELLNDKLTSGVFDEVEITHSSGEFDMLLARATSFLPATHFHGFAFNLRKKNGTVIPNKAAGAFVVCGGIPESLNSNFARSELGRIERARLGRNGKATMNFVVSAAHLGNLPGPFGHYILTCTYKLERVSTNDPQVPACPRG